MSYTANPIEPNISDHYSDAAKDQVTHFAVFLEDIVHC